MPFVAFSIFKANFGGMSFFPDASMYTYDVVTLSNFAMRLTSLALVVFFEMWQVFK